MKMKGTLKSDAPLKMKGTAAMKAGTPVKGKKVKGKKVDEIESNLIARRNKRG